MEKLEVRGGDNRLVEVLQLRAQNAVYPYLLQLFSVS